MIAQDREAFEKWYDASFTPGYAYPTSHRVDLWKAWQARADHYAPKANDESYTRGWNEAMDYAAEVNAPKLTEAEAKDIIFNTPNEDIMAALRAAGVKFRDEA